MHLYGMPIRQHSTYGTIIPLADGEMCRLLQETGRCHCAFGTAGAALILAGQSGKARKLAEWRGLLFSEGTGT